MAQLEQVRLGLDELEAMRLCDLDELDQETAGRHMGISRGTIQRLLQSGRAKILRALLDSSALIIEQGGSDAALHPHRG